MKYHVDNIIVLRQIPRENSTYPQNWILKQIIELLNKHQVRVVDPSRDIVFVEDQSDSTTTCVIFIDGFSEKRRLDHEPDEDGCEDQMLQLLYADSDDETEDNQEIVQEEKDENQIRMEELKKKKESGPTEYVCAACTFLNRLAN